jgi:hypothetical protein
MNRISSAMAALVLGAGMGATAYAGDAQQSGSEFKDPSNTAHTLADEQQSSENQHRSGPILYERTSTPEPHAQLPAGSHESGVVTPGQPDERSIAASGAAAESGSSGSMAGAAGSGTSDQEQVVAGGVRDWSRIDANDDNLVQPEEMEQWLQREGPRAAAGREARES